MKSKKVKGGFTLVELLAVIAILSIIVTVGIFVSTKVIKNSKEKGYEITANNIKAAASNYVVENPELIGWHNSTAECKTNSSCQMQCVTVQDLIDNGYFKEDILDSLIKSENEYRNVELLDSVYVERDATTKTITNVLFNESGCSGYGNITMSVSPNGWVNTKKDVIITYVLNGKEDVINSTYSYQINDNPKITKSFDGKNKVEVKLEITGNDSINVDINGNDSRTFYISTIDTDKPTYNANPLDIKVTNNRTMNFEFTDETSGLNQYYFGKTEPSDGTNVKYSKLANDKKVSTTEIVDTAGTWYLQVVDMAGNKTSNSYVFEETKLNIVNPESMSASVSRILGISGTEYDISTGSSSVVTVKPAIGYQFKGWYTKANGSGNKVTNVKVGDYGTLYGITEELKLEGGKVTISGTPKYNSTLTSSITGLNVTSGVTYQYQWYYNSSNSNTGGIAISGATSSSYTITNSILIDKYIYLVVTASKENYKDGVFKSNVLGPVKKADGFIRISETTGSITSGYTGTKVFYVKDHHGGQLTTSNNFNNSKVTVSLSDVATGGYKKIVTLANMSSLKAGSYKVTVTSGATATHESASANYELTITKSVEKSDGYITLSSTGSTVPQGATGKYSITFTVTSNHGGAVSVSDDSDTVVTGISGKTITMSNISSANAGTVKVTVTSAETKTHKAASTTYTLTISRKLFGKWKWHDCIDVNTQLFSENYPYARYFKISFTDAKNKSNEEMWFTANSGMQHSFVIAYEDGNTNGSDGGMEYALWSDDSPFYYDRTYYFEETKNGKTCRYFYTDDGYGHGYHPEPLFTDRSKASFAIIDFGSAGQIPQERVSKKECDKLLGFININCKTTVSVVDSYDFYDWFVKNADPID